MNLLLSHSQRNLTVELELQMPGGREIQPHAELDFGVTGQWDLAVNAPPSPEDKPASAALPVQCDSAMLVPAPRIRREQ